MFKHIFIKQNTLNTLLLVCSLVFISYGKSFAHGHSVYTSSDAFLNDNQSTWMKELKDNARFSELSLPGTHDTMTYGEYGLMQLSVQTQSMNLKKQLKNGIRVLDIRIRHTGNAFAIHHGRIFLKTMFGDVLLEVTDFLSKYPSETIFIRLKEDHDADNNNTRSMKETLEYYLNNHKTHYLQTTDPHITVKEMRGKFIILSDCMDFHSFGIKYSDFDIQDSYELSEYWDLYAKWEKVFAQYKKATKGSKDTVYVNYLSGSGDSSLNGLLVFPYFVASGHWSMDTYGNRQPTGKTDWFGIGNTYKDFPRVNCFILICTIAFEGTNVLLADYMTYDDDIDTFARRGAGIIMADFPGVKLIDGVIYDNKKVGNVNFRKF